MQRISSPSCALSPLERRSGSVWDNALLYAAEFPPAAKSCLPFILSSNGKVRSDIPIWHKVRHHVYLMNSPEPASALTRLTGPGAGCPMALSTEAKQLNAISLQQLAAEHITPSTAFATGPASNMLKILVDNSPLQS
jgi:hypothetical protein